MDITMLCLFFETVVPVFLVVHVCRTTDRVVGHPRPTTQVVRMIGALSVVDDSSSPALGGMNGRNGA